MSASLSGKFPPFSSLYYRYLYGDTPVTQQLSDFPFDVPYLSNHEIRQLQHAQQDFAAKLWPVERVDAYLGKDMLKKRAAASGFLWERLTENPAMTLAELKAWTEIERLDGMLRGVPAWFREQHPHDAETAWNVWIAPRRAEYEKRHQDVMKDILLMQKK